MSEKREEYLEQRNRWLKKIKINTNQEFKEKRIKETLNKLIDAKEIKVEKRGQKVSEYIPLEFEREMIREQIYKNLDKII